MRRSSSAVRFRVVMPSERQEWSAGLAVLLLLLVTEKATHWCSARLRRVLFGELDLYTVMAGFTERVNVDLFLARFQHLVELLVSRIKREFFCLLFS